MFAIVFCMYHRTVSGTVTGNVSSREIKFLGTNSLLLGMKVSGNENSWAILLLGANVPGSESSREQKFSEQNFPGVNWQGFCLVIVSIMWYPDIDHGVVNLAVFVALARWYATNSSTRLVWQLLNIWSYDFIRNADVCQITDKLLSSSVMSWHLSLFGHVAYMNGKVDANKYYIQPTLELWRRLCSIWLKIITGWLDLNYLPYHGILCLEAEVFKHYLSYFITTIQKLTGIFWKLVGKICLWLTGTASSQHPSSADDVTDDHGVLYSGHIPTSLFQKMLLSVGSSAMAITCPWRGGMYLFIYFISMYLPLIFICGCWESLCNVRFDLPAQLLSVFIVYNQSFTVKVLIDILCHSGSRQTVLLEAQIFSYITNLRTGCTNAVPVKILDGACY